MTKPEKKSVQSKDSDQPGHTPKTPLKIMLLSRDRLTQNATYPKFLTD